jgi:hypothetical protein
MKPLALLAFCVLPVVGQQVKAARPPSVAQDNLDTSSHVSIAKFRVAGQDDSVALQKAVSFCSSKKGVCTVVIPAGRFTVSAGVELNSPAFKGLGVLGEGMRATTIEFTGSGCLFRGSHGTALNRFSGFSVVGTARGAGAFCFSDANIASEIDHVEMTGFVNGSGVIIGDASANLLGEQIRINRCNFGALKTAVSLLGAAISIESSDFSAGVVGIAITTGLQASIRNNTFQAMTGHPIEVKGGAVGLSIVDNYFEANDADNIDIEGAASSAIRISQNYFRNNSSHYDVTLGGCDGCIIDANVYSGNVSAPARVFIAGGASTRNIFSSSSADLDRVPIFKIASPFLSGMIEETSNSSWIQGTKDGSAMSLRVPGFTGTKKMGGCSVTLTDGIVTAVNGC